MSEILLECSSEGVSEGVSKGTLEDNLEGTTEIDVTLEGDVYIFKEVDGLAILEGSNELIDGLLGIDIFTDGDLDCLEEGFVNADESLESFDAGFNEGPVEVRVSLDNAAIAG